jgi:Uma2 family endonuclease
LVSRVEVARFLLDVALRSSHRDRVVALRRLSRANVPSEPRRHRSAPESNEARRVPESGERLKAERLRQEGPLSHEPEMESDVHLLQLVLLLCCLRRLWRDRHDVYIGGNMSIYYPAVSKKTGRTIRRKLAFRGPDFFVVLGAKLKVRRNSWVVGNEDGKYPNVIIEVLSPRTQATDRGAKKEIYEKIFKTKEYILFDPDELALEGYRLVRGRYVKIQPDAAGMLRSEQLGLLLGIHDGTLRFFQPDGSLVPLPDEAANSEKARADREKARADRAEREKARLIAKLRKLGVDTDEADQTLQ